MDGLDDHCVDFVTGELDFKSRGAVGESERHGVEVTFIEVAELVGDVLPQQAEDVVELGLVPAVDIELLGDVGRESVVLHLDGVLDVLGYDIILNEFLKTFTEFSLCQFDQCFDGFF